MKQFSRGKCTFHFLVKKAMAYESAINPKIADQCKRDICLLSFVFILPAFFDKAFTHFMPLTTLDTSSEYQKTCFLVFLQGIEGDQ